MEKPTWTEKELVVKHIMDDDWVHHSVWIHKAVIDEKWGNLVQVYDSNGDDVSHLTISPDLKVVE